MAEESSRRSCRGRALPRVGLLGNPSDLYGGKGLAFTFDDFEAVVTLEAAPTVQIDPGAAHGIDGAILTALPAPPRHPDFDAAAPLLLSATRGFVRQFPEIAELNAADGFRITYQTDIPRQVGLAGSSALVVATLRALSDWFAVELSPFDLARLALDAEVEDLGIAAGFMDRIALAFEGALAMDFADSLEESTVERIDPGRLPPLYLAWDPDGGESSGTVHAEIRRRWLDGNPEVRKAIDIFPGLVDEGLACLETSDFAGFHAAIDRNFDTRASIWLIGERDRRMIEIARSTGASAKFCGSGGAIVGSLSQHDDFAPLAKELAAEGFESLVPTISHRSGKTS
ncbi:MAG: GHMP kinase [Myxococcota bacterium]